MPIREYRCDACGQPFEELVRHDVDDRTLSCPTCGEKAAKRRLSTFATSGGGSARDTGAGCGGGRGFT